MWRALTPELAVFDVGEAQRWYRDVLDAEIADAEEGGEGEEAGGRELGAVCIGTAELYLTRADEAISPATCHVRVDDADAAHAAVLARGAEVVVDPHQTGRGTREFTLRDPNGHLFRIAHEIAPVDP